MKKLSTLIKDIGVEEIKGPAGISVSGICFDSRKAVKGNLFVATRGTVTDGHRFIGQVTAMGVSAVICEEFPGETDTAVTYLKVGDSYHALALVSSAFYGDPSQKLKLIGITGTNGKTTTATLLYRLFRRLGYKTGLLSTVCNYIDGKEVPATHTTPDPLQLNRLISDMAESGCEYCFMEVSSHSVVQKRIDGLHFAGGVFTNLTHDHLDYHKTFSEYLKAKKMFFDALPGSAFALTNKDDRNGIVMLQNTKAARKTYALKSSADFKCRILEHHPDGMLLNINKKDVWTRFIGDFNAYNLLAVYSVAILAGQKKDEVLTLMSELVPVEGRFETFRSDRGITAVVDYAHTPDAVKNVLNTINHLRKAGEQIITVIGAGGDRDKTKRPVMAQIAVGMSDKVILTSDNPRSEDPVQIISEMMSGVDPADMAKVVSIENRADAIKTACMIASPGDIILVAGKGHETYQEIKGVRSHFDDREEIRKYFQIKS